MKTLVFDNRASMNSITSGFWAVCEISAYTLRELLLRTIRSAVVTNRTCYGVCNYRGSPLNIPNSEELWFRSVTTLGKLGPTVNDNRSSIMKSPIRSLSTVNADNKTSVLVDSTIFEHLFEYSNILRTIFANLFGRNAKLVVFSPDNVAESN